MTSHTVSPARADSSAFGERDLAAISARRGEQYSPNLYKHLRSMREPFRKLVGVYRGPNIIGGAGTTLYLGWLGDDGWFHGCRLYQALSHKTEVFAYPPKAGRFRLIKGFWQAYFRDGRCAIDKAHTQYFIDDESRWESRGKTRRHCLWCGKFVGCIAMTSRTPSPDQAQTFRAGMKIRARRALYGCYSEGECFDVFEAHNGGPAIACHYKEQPHYLHYGERHNFEEIQP